MMYIRRSSFFLLSWFQ